MPTGSERAERPVGSTASGYTLVMVVMMITLLNIMVAIALPLWSGMVKRDKEEELISRGLQYAEAIRVFQRRFGRLPVQLDELVKVEPRSIRRLWEDPMTGKVDWIVIFEGTPPGAPGIDPTTGLPLPPGGAAPPTPPGPEDPSSKGGEENPPPQVGPIRGVRSRATGEAFHVFLDQSDYGSWEFRSDIFSRFRAAPSENGLPRISALTIGRPFRFPLGAGMPGPGSGLPPGGAPGGPGATQPPRPKLRSQADFPPPEEKN
jgi:type II secretory pathway pseudopilin PulG